MDRIIPWLGLVDAITPLYPNPQGAGRRPIGTEPARDETTICKFRRF